MGSLVITIVASIVLVIACGIAAFYSGMSNLFITVIAIAVMIVGGGMFAYYIGTTYQTTVSRAASNSVLNEAEQLAGMWKNFMIGTSMAPPADWSELIDAGFARSVMEYSPGANTGAEKTQYFQIWPDDSGRHYFAVVDLGDPAFENGNRSCNRILGLATGTKLPDSNVPALIPDFTAETLDTVAPRFTCGPVGAPPRQPAVQQISVPPTFPPLTHNLLIYRLS